jgi:hypothetical protein
MMRAAPCPARSHSAASVDPIAVHEAVRAGVGDAVKLAAAEIGLAPASLGDVFEQASAQPWGQGAAALRSVARFSSDNFNMVNLSVRRVARR